MSSKHTPGPWVVTPHPDQNVDVFAVGEVTDEAFQYGLSHTICYQNAEANARLIAAAPELLTIVARELRNGEQSHFEDWLERTCPSGDVEAVKRQWLESADYALFADEYREELAVLDKIEGHA